MRYNILIGGSAGQGINKVSQIMSEILTSYGYFTFNYRDYQSLVRGGHNFNVLNFSDTETASTDFFVDIIVALDNHTEILHRGQLKRGGLILKDETNYTNKNLNLILCGKITKIFGISKDILVQIVKKHFNSKEANEAVLMGYDSEETKFNLKKLKNKLTIMSGSEAVAIGAKKSNLNFFISYPMTPATGVLNEIAKIQNESLKVFQAENEIAVANMALGTSFAGKLTMIGTSGGGFDLMTEAFSLQGISEIPLTVYLASRPGPATGVPTYTSQSDLNVALYAGHGEFARVVCAPGDPIEAIEKTNELLMLSEKYGVLSILLSDKHLAEGEYSENKIDHKLTPIKISRSIPGSKIVKASSYEMNINKNSTEDSLITINNVNSRLGKIKNIELDVSKLVMYKTYGRKKSKNLIIGWGSTKGAIKDSIRDIDAKFLQIIYLSPFSKEIEQEIKKASKVVLIENNATAQLGSLIKQKIGIEIKDKILKYDGRPFFADELNKQIKKMIK